MHIRNVVVLVAAGLLLASPAQAADSKPYARGGSTKKFGEDVQRYNHSGEKFRITGHCQSACTMFLAVRTVCVEPTARLLFHAGDNDAATQRMLNSYNRKLRSYVLAKKLMATPAFSTISGRDIIKRFGYRAC
ncbi:MAG: hypothetical protein ABI391_08975 [Hyphomicrobiaceae bacterium]